MFLINPGAGQRAAVKVRAVAPALFPSAEWQLDFVDLKNWREIRPLARAAAAKGAFAVVAVGGDGTINQVAPALVGTRCRLGIIPAGTGNGLARALWIPLDTDGACRVISAANEQSIDYGAMDLERGYANMLGLGWDAWIAARANQLRWMNKISGFLRYLGAAILCLPKLGTQAVKLEIDGKSVQGEFLVVAVANSPQYGFGCTIAPAALLNDGYFDVVCLPPIGPITFARNLPRLFTKQPLLGANFYRAKKVKLMSAGAEELPIHLDGEPGGTTPATITVRPKALRVLVP